MPTDARAAEQRNTTNAEAAHQHEPTHSDAAWAAVGRCGHWAMAGPARQGQGQDQQSQQLECARSG